MAVSPAETQPRGSLDFVESSVLEAVVPANSDIDIKDEFSSWSGALEDEGGSLLPFLTQRHIILLGEKPFLQDLSTSLTYTQASR